MHTDALAMIHVCLFVDMYVYVCTSYIVYGVALSVMVINKVNGVSNLGSNPGQAYLHFTLC